MNYMKQHVLGGIAISEGIFTVVRSYSTYMYILE
jgi:hypothetical protein